MIKHYTLADLIRMAPGTLLTGLIRDEGSWRLAPEWSLPEGLVGAKNVRTSPFLEHRVRWRQHLRKHSKLIGDTRIYRPESNQIVSSENRRIITTFKVGSPIGIYLGHIVRINGVSFVNVLTTHGYDVWI